MTNVLMLASFGLEIVECGGALAKAIRPATACTRPC